jgi:phage tail sheath protein FI
MVERLYPGVYITEIPFHATPIAGVSTSTLPADAPQAAARDAHLPSEPAPDWTQDNDSNPGITLLHLPAWLGESLLFRAQPNPIDRTTRVQSGWGVVQGLAVEPHAADAPAGVQVSPGLATTTD